MSLVDVGAIAGTIAVFCALGCFMYFRYIKH